MEAIARIILLLPLRKLVLSTVLLCYGAQGARVQRLTEPRATFTRLQERLGSSEFLKFLDGAWRHESSNVLKPLGLLFLNLHNLAGARQHGHSIHSRFVKSLGDSPRVPLTMLSETSLPAPSAMRTKEIKEELDARSVQWRGVYFEKDELVEALEEARASSPSLVKTDASTQELTPEIENESSRLPQDATNATAKRPAEDEDSDFILNSANATPQELLQELVDKINEGISFLPVFFQSKPADVEIPQQYFLDLAKLVTTIPAPIDRTVVWEALASELGKGIDRLDPPSFAMAAWCLNTVRVPLSNPIWSKVAEVAPSLVGKLHPNDLSMFAYTIGRMQLKSAPMLNALFKRILEVLYSFSTRDVLNILTAMARLDYKDDRITEILQLYPPEKFSSPEWIRMTWAVYRLRPEVARKTYFPRFIKAPSEISANIFAKLEHLARNTDAEAMSSMVPIVLVRNFVTDEECQQLTALAEKQGLVSLSNPVREVNVTALTRQDTRDDPVVVDLQTRAAALLGLSRGFCEPLNYVRYSYGEQHLDHFDCMQEVDVEHDMSKEDPLADSSLLGGQRHSTVLIYLNTLTEDQGGATVFPCLGVRVQPEKGAALVWPNIGHDGLPNPFTMHAAEAVKNGAVKLVSNAWLRSEDMR